VICSGLLACFRSRRSIPVLDAANSLSLYDVRDRDGRYVVDLKQEDFRIYEEGTEQQIAHFGGVEEPISVVLLIDVERVRPAVLRFLFDPGRSARIESPHHGAESRVEVEGGLYHVITSGNNRRMIFRRARRLPQIPSRESAGS